MMHSGRKAALMCLFVLIGTGFAMRPAMAQGTDPRLNQGFKAEAIGDQVMVSTQHPLITEAGVKVLRDGGNAVDALISMVFLQHVHQYSENYLFGSASGIYYEAATGKYHVFNGWSDRPLAGRCGQGDPSQVAIGGTVRTMEALWKRFGTRDWASYLESAAQAAEEGALVTSFMYGENFAQLESGNLTSNPALRDFYMPDGHLVPVGERWPMPELAKTLRKIGKHGASHVYTGEWGQRFVDEAKKRGYCLSLEDMAEYETRWVEPLRFTFRGHEILMEPAPVAGGLEVGYMLNILENFDLRASGHYSESPETLELMARAFGRVAQETRLTIQDPVSFRNPADLWLSKEYGRLSAQFVRQTMRHPGVRLGAGGSPEAGLDMIETAQDIAWTERVGSQHNVIVDAAGNWITMLHTSHGGAPGVFIDGVRAFGSGMRSETRGPGRRTIAPVAGTMIIRDGKPWMALGTPGNPPQPITEVLLNILEYGMGPKDAAEAPRFWAFRGATDRTIEIESRITPQVREGLRDSGITIRDLAPFYWRTGSMQIVWRDKESAKLHGVSDPRRLGYAAGY